MKVRYKFKDDDEHTKKIGEKGGKWLEINVGEDKELAERRVAMFEEKGWTAEIVD